MGLKRRNLVAQGHSVGISLLFFLKTELDCTSFLIHISFPMNHLILITAQPIMLTILQTQFSLKVH